MILRAEQEDIKTSYLKQFIICTVIVGLIISGTMFLFSVVSINKAKQEIDNLIPDNPKVTTVKIPTMSIGSVKEKLKEVSKNTKNENKSIISEYLKREVVYSKGSLWTDVIIYYTVDTEKLLHLYYKDVTEYNKVVDALKDKGFIAQDDNKDPEASTEITTE